MRPDIAASMPLPKPDAICAPSVSRQSPQNPEQIAIDGNGLRLVNDQRAGHVAPELLQAAGVWR